MNEKKDFDRLMSGCLLIVVSVLMFTWYKKTNEKFAEAAELGVQVPTLEGEHVWNVPVSSGNPDGHPNDLKEVPEG